ncbi:hypothetical protein ACFSE1_06120 [Rhizobium helianthi]|uniref:DUF4424 domain-containing protein n=1 Tax=Rhizobium helianthi TaxID=1132695 RepID=A0ABW4M387_9HYPH
MSSKRLFKFVLATAIVVLQCDLLAARDLDIRLFGHRVSIAKSNDDQFSLKVDDREIHRNYFVDIDDVHVVGGTPVAVGASSGGGNACESSPFVLSFPEGQNARIDGPLDNCMPVKVTVSQDKLYFAIAPQPGTPGKRWEWTAGQGFREVGSEAFVADTSKGWDQLRERTIDHPAALLSYAEVARQINGLAGEDEALVKDILLGVGSGEFKGDLFVGTTCTRHMCDEQQAIVVADLRSRSVYLAWKPSGQKIKVQPVVGAWPEKVKAELRLWAAKWK